MKRLELNQMEVFLGGKKDGGHNRQCSVIGLVIGLSAPFFWTGVGAGILAGAVLTGANTGCF